MTLPEQFEQLLERYENVLVYLENPPRGFPLEELILRARFSPIPWHLCFVWVKLQMQAAAGVDLIDSEQVLELFLLRDEIQSFLQKESQLFKVILPRIKGLDERLKAQAVMIAQTCPLEQWRELRTPSETSWWWFFQSPEGVHPWERFDWLWNILTVPVLAFNFSLVINVSSRFISGGVDPFGAFAVVSQGMLAMITAGGTFTQKGRQNIETVLTRLNIPKHFWQEAQLGGSLMAMFILLGFQASLPNIAKSYIEKGQQNVEKNFLDSALEDYNRADKLDPNEKRLKEHLNQISQRYVERGKIDYEEDVINAFRDFEQAITLNPNNMEAHFLLGVIYEDALEFDKARQEYQIAMLGHYPQAFLALARLYLLEDKNYSEVITFLHQSEKEILQVESEFDYEPLQFLLLKNRGWARLKQKRYDEAEADLREAIELQKRSLAPDLQKPFASPFCLLAQALEGQEKEVEAISFWENCINYSDRDLPEEDQWFYLANQRLTLGREKGIYKD